LVSGDQVNLQCNSNKGDLPIQFQWSYQSTNLSTESHSGIRIMKLGPRTSVLMITELNPSQHLGAYTCTAKSAAGTSNFTAYLKAIMGLLVLNTFVCSMLAIYCNIYGLLFYQHKGDFIYVETRFLIL